MHKTKKSISVLLVALLFFLKAAGLSVYAVQSGSMEPALKTGGLVFISRKAQTFHPGDIVTYEAGGIYITHRIIQSTENAYITKGDANSSADPVPVMEKQIRGKAVFTLPVLGYIIVFLRRKTVLTAALFILLLAGTQEILQNRKHNKIRRMAENSAEKEDDKEKISRKENSAGYFTGSTGGRGNGGIFHGL